MQIDLFCRVVDNYGDIGVCWRLARQLVAQHGCNVRLIVDDLNAFRIIAPEIDAAAAPQSLLGVEVVAWREDIDLTPGDVVIEAFACDPPASYVEAMALRSPKPVWLNLEYLSAEAWVDEVHGMPSQHQRLPLTKYFFCPGFTEVSGGLIRERLLVPSPGGGGLGWGQLVSKAIHDQLRAESPHPVPPGEGAKPAALQVFAFAYPHAPVHALAQGFASARVATTVTLAAPLVQSGPQWQTAPPVAQTEFDALLAHYDFLIVRGEDSFVRAQWAAIPFLWHIYPTDDGAHLIKLDAWLDCYCAGLEGNAAAAYRAASHAFNSTQTIGAQSAPYEHLAHHLATLAGHAERWRAALMQQTDLATRLIAFIETLIEPKSQIK